MIGISQSTSTGKERDTETGYGYFGARYMDHELMTMWLSVDPMADKYPGISPYAYCAWNPVKLVDPTGEEWVDADGNIIKDHSKIKVYIFYDPNAFKKQSLKMYKSAEEKYGKGSVALSNVTTETEFAQDWKNMASPDIKEVNLNYHGNNQTLMLDSPNKEYITSTGDGLSNRSGKSATNVQDLSTPIGKISDAQLNINSCKSNSRTQYPLKGSGQTLMEAFANTFNFKSIRGTSAGVSYNIFTKKPEPQHYYEHWDYIPARQTPSSPVYCTPVYYKTGGMR